MCLDETKVSSLLLIISGTEIGRDLGGPEAVGDKLSGYEESTRRINSALFSTGNSLGACGLKNQIIRSDHNHGSLPNLSLQVGGERLRGNHRVILLCMYFIFYS